MRPIMMPAMLTILGSWSTERVQLNWSPANKPPVMLTDEEEEHALAAGLWDPRELAALRAALAAADDAAAAVAGAGGAPAVSPVSIKAVADDAAAAGAGEPSLLAAA